MKSVKEFLRDSGYYSIPLKDDIQYRVSRCDMYVRYKGYCISSRIEYVSQDVFESCLSECGFEWYCELFELDFYWRVFSDMDKTTRSLSEVSSELSSLCKNYDDLVRVGSSVNDIETSIYISQGEKNIILRSDVINISEFIESYLEHCNKRITELKEEIKTAKI